MFAIPPSFRESSWLFQRYPNKKWCDMNLGPFLRRIVTIFPCMDDHVFRSGNLEAGFFFELRSLGLLSLLQVNRSNPQWTDRQTHSKTTTGGKRNKTIYSYRTSELVNFPSNLIHPTWSSLAIPKSSWCWDDLEVQSSQIVRGSSMISEWRQLDLRFLWAVAWGARIYLSRPRHKQTLIQMKHVTVPTWLECTTGWIGDMNLFRL